MLLRRSGEQSNEAYDLTGVTGESRVGVQHEDILLMVAEAVVDSRPDAAATMRRRAGEVLGEQQMLDAIGIASAFHGITKIANATGLPLDARTSEITVELRQVTGIENYAEAYKSSVYDLG
tara:strand:- start:31 stop:393 length:363 start_codon:yes stop_codon:yes gene_type:complete